MVALSFIGVALLLASCAFGAYVFIRDESNPPRDAQPAPSLQPRDIGSQEVDPAPLTEQELFPGTEIVPVKGEAAYQILKVQPSEDCKVAAADDLGVLLTNLGCTQVVRGTLKHPSGKYLVTAGLFNLKDHDNAQKAHDNVKPTIDAKKGRFNGLMAGSGTEAIVRAPTQLGWMSEGHFLAYCVIARADGQAFEATDEYPKQIIFDIVNTYLIYGVVGARAAPVESASQPTGTGGSSAPAN
jgi:hypothetical protein